MKIIIHRGQNQIGGNIIEIFTKDTKILLDAGIELDNDKNIELPKIDGLFDIKGYDGVFITHYHMDHMGLAYDIYKDIPIYMGDKGFKIIEASDNYKNIKLDEKNKKSFVPAGYLTHKKSIEVGSIKITPYLFDHSAFDSYMLLVEGDDQRIIYTGDFRANGRKSFDKLLRELPENIDALICEGTTLSRDNVINKTEKELEYEAVALFKDCKGPIFVLMSSMNIDRIVTMYRTAKRCNRLFLQELYMAEITNAVGGRIPNPLGFNDNSVKVFMKQFDEERHELLFNKYNGYKIGIDQISKNNKFIMCIRSTMGNYLKSLSKKMSFEGGYLVYSFWNGYKKQDEMKAFLSLCENLGLKVADLHTSGHADANTILRLINKTKPKAIIPVHTENEAWFKNNIENDIIVTDKHFNLSNQ